MADDEANPLDASLHIDIELGPALRISLDVLELASEVIEEMPEGAKRDELTARAEGLGELCERLLKTGGET